MKAYALRQLRAFHGWSAAAPEDSQHELSGETIVYLRDDLVVTRDVFPDSQVMLVQPDDEWRRFCSEVLGFATPDWSSEAEEVRAELLRRLQQSTDRTP